MTIRNLLVAGAAVAALFGASVASAETININPNAFTGAVVVGGNSVNGDPAVGVALGYDLNPTWGVEAEYDHTNTRVRKGINPETDQVQLDAVYHLASIHGFQPYAIAGFGGRWSEDTRWGRDQEEGTWNVGGGVNKDITKKVFVGVRGEYLQGFESSKEEALFTARVGYRF